ncbi:hypothetical protein KAI87_11720, partial [Myxococcota bacterium]|nr:hypothetical protein [Myxococcota bacterium]
DNLTFYRENYVAKLPSGYLTTSYRDETEEKQAERVFLKNAEAYRDLFEHSPIVLVRQDITQVTARLNELRQKGVSDLEAHLREHPDEIERLLGMIQMIDVNERAVELYGAKSKEHLIANWTHTLQDNSIESFLFGLKATWEERKRFSFEGTQHTLDGRRLNILLESNINPQQDNAGRIIILSMQDITERVRLEKDKVRLEKQVRDAEKMQAIGRLGGGVAHEFNNMLCTISGNASLALSDLPTGDPVRESIEDIKDASDRAAQLTRQLLAFSQKQIRTALNLDISQILNDLYPTLAQRINANITLRFSPQKHLGLIHVDPRHLQQIIIDLAINAQDAMPDGGELLIETSEAELPKELCLPNETNLAGSCVTLRVSDTGQGIDPEIRQKIFEPFFTTRDQSKNSGLRLPTVFGVVKQNGGYIKVSSEPGKGSSFVVYFPKTAAPHESPNTDEVIPLTGGNETILVVDDEKMVCTLAVRLLKR